MSTETTEVQTTDFTTFIEIAGVPVGVPNTVVHAGPEAVHRWFTEQDHPHAQALAQQHGLRPREITATGDAGRILTSDVQRALLAREAAKATPAADPTTPEPPKEG